MSFGKKLPFVAVPILILAVGAGAAWTLINLKPEVETVAPTLPAPFVKVTDARIGDVELFVETHGTVSPRTESNLVSEVSGRVQWVSPSLTNGGFFEADEPLLRIDPRDYELALAQAELGVARADRVLAMEEADAEIARREWEDLGEGEPTPLTLREPQIVEARAAQVAARATLETARRDLERAELTAPYAGRVRSESVDLGQFVVRGQTLARVYAVETAEIRLPLADAQLAFLDLALGYRSDDEAMNGPVVVIEATFGGREHRWDGRIVRTEGELDPQSRMVVAVAEVEDPYGRSEDLRRPPLTVGMFVRARIRGRLVRDVAVLPRLVLRGADSIWVADESDQLRIRTVEVVRVERDKVVLRSGVEEGDRVIVSTLDAAHDGMPVTVAQGD